MKEPSGPFYFTFKYRDEEEKEHEAQYSGYVTRAEASKDKRAQQAFNSGDRRARKKYYDFSPIRDAAKIVSK